MNPWISEPLAASHRDQLRRVAASRIYPTERAYERPVLSNRPPVEGVRRGVGSFLIRAGRRLGGLDTPAMTLPAEGQSFAC